MRVQRIQNISPKVNFGVQKKNTNPTHSISAPMHDGLSTAGAWFGFGVVLDFVSRKCHFFKSPVKNSIVMNGLIGIGAGVITCTKEKFFDSKDKT